MGGFTGHPEVPKKAGQWGDNVFPARDKVMLTAPLLCFVQGLLRHSSFEMIRDEF